MCGSQRRCDSGSDYQSRALGGDRRHGLRVLPADIQVEVTDAQRARPGGDLVSYRQPRTRIDTLALATGQDADKIKSLAKQMPINDVEPYFS